MSSYLITGAGRGIGLELASQLSSLPESQVSTVFATTRSSASDGLEKLIDASKGRVVHVPVEITDKISISKAVKLVDDKLGGSKGLDCLINVAGILPYTPNGIETMGDELQEAFEVNVQAVHNVTSVFLPLLRKGELKKVVNISTTLGSIAQAPKYKWAPAPAYKITKAALSMLTVQYAHEYEMEGFTVIAVSPGWLRTDMGSQDADLDVNVGVKAVLNVVMKSGRESNGKFLNIHVPGWENAEGPNQYDGKGVPW